jgi:hypothetical protein
MNICVLNPFTNHAFSFMYSIFIIYFDFFVSGPLFDLMAQRSEGVKQCKLHASSVAFL